MPALVAKMLVDAPYLIDWLIPQNSLAGAVLVRGLCAGELGFVVNKNKGSYANPMVPVNLELSVPPVHTNEFRWEVRYLHTHLPQVSSPFKTSTVLVGLNEMPISLFVMIPREKRLSVTVGISVPVAGDSVPIDRFI